LKATKKGFVNIPSLGFDGCHLNEGLWRVLLSTASLDDSNRLLIFAYVVVECENNDT